MIPQDGVGRPESRRGICYSGVMNFLAHLVLAGDDDYLRLGAMLGDFVRGRRVLAGYPRELARGIRLHRHIDALTDALPEVMTLREAFVPPFRRYAGIIIDLGFDHVLARRWADYGTGSLEDFDHDVRDLLERHRRWVPVRLQRFMAYADRRGLFAAYREESEILHSLRGVGRRMSRPNPLHRVDTIWQDFAPRFDACFGSVFGQVQSAVAAWLRSTSTTTGS